MESNPTDSIGVSHRFSTLSGRASVSEQVVSLPARPRCGHCRRVRKVSALQLETWRRASSTEWHSVCRREHEHADDRRDGLRGLGPLRSPRSSMGTHGFWGHAHPRQPGSRAQLQSRTFTYAAFCAGHPGTTGLLCWRVECAQARPACRSAVTSSDCFTRASLDASSGRQLRRLCSSHAPAAQPDAEFSVATRAERT